MKAEDFKLERVDKSNGHDDYWFKVNVVISDNEELKQILKQLAQ